MPLITDLSKAIATSQEPVPPKRLYRAAAISPRINSVVALRVICQAVILQDG